MKKRKKNKKYDTWKISDKIFDIQDEVAFLKDFENDLQNEFSLNYQDNMSFSKYLSYLIGKYKSEAENLNSNVIIFSIITIALSIYILGIQSLLKYVSDIYSNFFLELLIVVIFIIAVVLGIKIPFTQHRNQISKNALIVYFLENKLANLPENKT